LRPLRHLVSPWVQRAARLLNAGSSERAARSKFAQYGRSPESGLLSEQAVADPRLSGDVARPLRIPLELLAQACDVDVQVVVFVAVLRSPYFAQQHCVGHDVIRVTDERGEKRVLRRREVK